VVQGWKSSGPVDSVFDMDLHLLRARNRDEFQVADESESGAESCPIPIQRQLRVTDYCSQWVAPGEVMAP
jgi:hypothetical protein